MQKDNITDLITTSFEVENIKCGGCMHSIKKGLEEMEGVQEAEANNVNGTVTISYDEQLVHADALLQKLAAMGYPLVGENTLGRQVKSMVSCAIGRVTKD